MLKSRIVRTTISLPEDLLFEIKKIALVERKTIKEVIGESLRLFLRINTTKSSLDDNAAKSYKVDRLFGILGKGESGEFFVRRVRSTKADRQRDSRLKKLWKKSL